MSDQTKFPSDFAERFQVRMPEGLRARIADAAKANNRSMNSEIVARLESSFAGPEESWAALRTARAQIEQVMAALSAMQEGQEQIIETLTKQK